MPENLLSGIQYLVTPVPVGGDEPSPTLGDDPGATLDQEAAKFGLKRNTQKRNIIRDRRRNSYHLYSGESGARDYNGPPDKLKAFTLHLRDTYGDQLSELFHDPVGGWKNGRSVGAIGGHRTHTHVAWGNRGQQRADLTSGIEHLISAAGQSATAKSPNLAQNGTSKSTNGAQKPAVSDLTAGIEHLIQVDNADKPEDAGKPPAFRPELASAGLSAPPASSPASGLLPVESGPDSAPKPPAVEPGEDAFSTLAKILGLGQEPETEIPHPARQPDWAAEQQVQLNHPDRFKEIDGQAVDTVSGEPTHIGRVAKAVSPAQPAQAKAPPARDKNQPPLPKLAVPKEQLPRVPDQEMTVTGSELTEGELYRDWFDARSRGDIGHMKQVAEAYFKLFPTGEHQKWVVQSLKQFKNIDSPEAQQRGAGAYIPTQDIEKMRASGMHDEQILKVIQDEIARQVGLSDADVVQLTAKYGKHPFAAISEPGGEKSTIDSILRQGKSNRGLAEFNIEPETIRQTIGDASRNLYEPGKVQYESAVRSITGYGPKEFLQDVASDPQISREGFGEVQSMARYLSESPKAIRLIQDVTSGALEHASGVAQTTANIGDFLRHPFATSGKLANELFTGGPARKGPEFWKTVDEKGEPGKPWDPFVKVQGKPVQLSEFAEKLQDEADNIAQARPGTPPISAFVRQGTKVFADLLPIILTAEIGASATEAAIARATPGVAEGAELVPRALSGLQEELLSGAARGTGAVATAGERQLGISLALATYGAAQKAHAGAQEAVLNAGLLAGPYAVMSRSGLGALMREAVASRLGPTAEMAEQALTAGTTQQAIDQAAGFLTKKLIAQKLGISAELITNAGQFMATAAAIKAAGEGKALTKAEIIQQAGIFAVLGGIPLVAGAAEIPAEVKGARQAAETTLFGRSIPTEGAAVEPEGLPGREPAGRLVGMEGFQVAPGEEGPPPEERPAEPTPKRTQPARSAPTKTAMERVEEGFASEPAAEPRTTGRLTRIVKGLVDPETGGLRRGGDFVTRLASKSSTPDVIELLKWSRSDDATPFVKRFVADDAAAELRSRGVPVDEIEWQHQNLGTQRLPEGEATDATEERDLAKSSQPERKRTPSRAAVSEDEGEVRSEEGTSPGGRDRTGTETEVKPQEPVADAAPAPQKAPTIIPKPTSKGAEPPSKRVEATTIEAQAPSKADVAAWKSANPAAVETLSGLAKSLGATDPVSRVSRVITDLITEGIEPTEPELLKRMSATFEGRAPVKSASYKPPASDTATLQAAHTGTAPEHKAWQDAVGQIEGGDTSAGAIQKLRAAGDALGLAPATVNRIEDLAKETAIEGQTQTPTAGTGRGEGERATLPERRTPTSTTAPGKETSIHIPGENKSYRARYEVRELSDLQASHHPTTFNPNPDYFFTNERDYGKTVNQARVVENSAEGKFEPAYLITDTPTATDGPPIIDAEGNVLSGNARTMTLARVYGSNRAGADAYKRALMGSFRNYGIALKQLREMKQPVLVRVIDDPEIEAQTVIRETNIPGTAALTQSEQAIADARKVPESAITYLTAQIDKLGDDATLAKVMEGKGGVDVVSRMIDEGVFAPQERPRLIDDRGLVTKEAKDRIAWALIGRVFRDLDQLENTPQDVRNKLERIIAPLIQTQQNPKWNLTDTVNGAIDALREAKAHRMNLDDLSAQGTMFGGGRYSPAELAVAKKLQEGPIKAAKAFKGYAADESDARIGQASLMGPPPEQRESFARHFGIELPDYQPFEDAIREEIPQVKQMPAEDYNRVVAKLEAIKKQAKADRQPLSVAIQDFLDQRGLFGGEFNEAQSALLRELATRGRKAARNAEQGSLFDMAPTLESETERRKSDPGFLFSGGGLFEDATTPRGWETAETGDTGLGKWLEPQATDPDDIATFAWRDRRNYLALNKGASKALFRVHGRPVAGLAMNQGMAENYARRAEKLAGKSDNVLEQMNLQALADHLRDSAGRRSEFGVVAVRRGMRGTLRHETAHVAQLALERFFKQAPPEEAITKLPGYDQVRRGLTSKGYSEQMSPRVAAHEAAAHIVAGQWKDIGLDFREGLVFADAYFGLLARTYRPDALKRFDSLTGRFKEVRNAVIARVKEERGNVTRAGLGEAFASIPSVGAGRQEGVGPPDAQEREGALQNIGFRDRLAKEFGLTEQPFELPKTGPLTLQHLEQLEASWDSLSPDQQESAIKRVEANAREQAEAGERIARNCLERGGRYSILP